jgi:hypothetical protein
MTARGGGAAAESDRGISNMDGHPPSICVVFSGNGWRWRSTATTGGYGDRRQQQAVAVAGALAAAVVTSSYGGVFLWYVMIKKYDHLIN